MPPAIREHGTRAKYVVEKCRCDLCRASTREYERERRTRAVPAYVGADRARQHVRYLSENGVGLKQVVKVSGVSQGAIWKLMYGKDGRPSKRIRRDTEQAILAVTVDQAAGGSREPAGPTWDAISELLRRGWTKRAIARAVTGNPDANGLQVGEDLVERATARAVRALLDQPVPPRVTRFGEREARPPTEGEIRRYSRWDETPEADDVSDRLVDLPDLRLPDGLDLSWRAQGACRRPEFPLWMFFPARGDVRMLRAAKAVCARCPVHVECLDFAVQTNSLGVWGGTSEKERRDLRRGQIAS